MGCEPADAGGDNGEVTTFNRLAVAAGAAGALGALAVAGRGVPAALGARATGPRLARMQRSPHYRDGAFHNRLASARVMPAGQRVVTVLRRV